MSTPPTALILVNEKPLEFVEDLISKDSGVSKDITARLGKRLRVPSPNSVPSEDQNNTA